jgi:hypothetical protein
MCKGNLEASSCNRCWRGKARGITNSDIVSVARFTITQNEWAVLHCYLRHMCWVYHIFHFISQGTRLSEKVLNKKCVLWFFSRKFVWNISYSKNNGARYGDMVINVYRSSLITIRYSCQIVMKGEFSRRLFGKYSHIKFPENPSNGSRVVSCGRMDRQTWRS